MAGQPRFVALTKAYVFGLLFSRITHHPHWKAALTHVRTNAHSAEVIIAPFALLVQYYGPPLPIYHLNNNMMTAFDLCRNSGVTSCSPKRFFICQPSLVKLP